MKRIALIAMVLVEACLTADAISSNDDVARDAAIQWLQLIDGGRYEEAASLGSTEVRSFEQWSNDFKTRRAPLGKVISRHLLIVSQRSTFPSAFQVRKYYAVSFKTSFVGKPGANEVVTLAKIGCCWEVFEYKVE